MSTQNPARGMRPSYRALLLATTAVLVLDIVPRVAIAQDVPGKAQEAPAKAVEELIVTGYRKSLQDARKIKRDSVIEKDAIVAEDMAKFPELNLAESLQRLPGVQITREAGEGRRISLRGFGPDFSRVQLNGMEVLGNVDSAQDSRGQRSRDRSFDFNIFASDLFSKVEVEKTFQASQTEGGLAGTIGLFTGKPLDAAPGTKGALSVKVGSNQYTEDVQPRVAAFISQNWNDRFGAAFSVTYSHRKTTEQGHNTYNYTQPSADDMKALVASGLDISHLSATQQAKFLSGDLYFADGNRISSWNATADRLGLSGTLQWKPVNNLEFTLDALHGEFTTHRDELHLATRPINGPGSTTLDGPAGGPWPAQFQTASVVNKLAWDSSNYVTMSDVSGVTFGSEHRRELNENSFNQGVLTMKWEPTSRLTVDGHIGAEESSYKTPYDDKLYMRARGNLIADYGPTGQTASFQYPGWDPTNPANYAMDNFYYRSFHNESKLEEGALNLHYKASNIFTIQAGVAYHRFAEQGMNLFYDGGANGTTAKTRGTSVADITDVFTNSFGSWLIGDYAKAFAKYHEYHRLGPNTDGSGGALQDIEQVFKVTESTVAEYFQVDWDTQLFGKTFRGNAGVRGYQTDTHSAGWIQGDSYAYLGTADVKSSYSGVLPAFNSVLELTPELLARFSVTENLNRPTLSALAAQGVAFDDNGKITASRGDPGLKPYSDTSIDFALEYYFGKVGLMSADFFQKYVKNFVDYHTLDNVPFSQSGIPYQTIPGATSGTIINELTLPYNVPGTHTITGVEIAAQSQFFFLPKPFDNLGVVANFTYLDTAFSGFSKTSYNATLYYETAKWGVRTSLSHRSRYFTGYNSQDPMSADTRGFQGSTYVDAAAFYNLTKRIQFTVDAVNLTNQTDTQFWGQNLYLYNQNQSGVTVLGGVAYRF